MHDSGRCKYVTCSRFVWIARFHMKYANPCLLVDEKNDMLNEHPCASSVIRKRRK
jgi:hypothetical protein